MDLHGNLAPASWTAAVPAAAFSWDLDFGIYLEVGRWNVEFFLHEPTPHRIFTESVSENLGDIHRHGAGRVAPTRYRTSNSFVATASSRCSSRLHRHLRPRANY